MIEKNKFKEKILSEHTSGADLKVIFYLINSLLFALERDLYLKNNKQTDK